MYEKHCESKPICRRYLRKSKKPTYYEKVKREKDLADIISLCEANKIKFTYKTGIKIMKERGWKDYNKDKLYQDRRSPVQKNTFLEDLTSSTNNLSRQLEEMWKVLDFFIQHAKRQLKETNSPKWSQVLIQSVNAKTKIFNGDFIDISLALVSKSVENLRGELEESKRTIEHLEQNLREQSKSNT